MNFKITIISLALSFFATSSYAEEIYLDSGDQKVVQAAVNSANDGDIIILPQGEWTYKTLNDKTPSVNIIDKNITIMGNGVNKTIITDATGSDFKTNAFRISGTKPTRISGISFRGAVNNGNGIINISDQIKGFRIDHCDFKNVSSGIHILKATGLIDHCTFYVTISESISSIMIFGTGDESWASPLNLGTDNAVYIEDSTFLYSYKNDSALQGHDGARYVFRHNKVIGTVVDAHGKCGTLKRGSFSYEIYNNEFISDLNRARAMFLRGGTGVVYNNTIDANYQSPISVTDYLICNYVHSICRENSCDSYPCLDQIGRSTNQSLEPLYEWNNFHGNVDTNIIVSNFNKCSDPSVLDVIKEGRDYLNDTIKPGYTSLVYPHPLSSQSLSLNLPIVPRVFQGKR